MFYRLGIDLGTTYTAAAVLVGDHPEMLALGNRALQVPTVLFADPDGTLSVGEVAEQRGTVEPDRLVREFKRRVGDTVPIIVSGVPYSPQALVATVLRWVVDVASQRQGDPPAEITVTHPASWGPFKVDLLRQSIRLADLHEAELLTEPEAAAVTYARRHGISDGETVAVYDLGGGTFDAAVLRREGSRFRLLGDPEGIEHLGGVDFDDAVFHHVWSSLRDRPDGLDQDDPTVTMALARLRRDCVIAKEALSSDTEVTLAVVLPGLSTSVRLTRQEFDEMLRAPLEATVAATRRVLRSAEVSPDQLRAIVLIGGSSRIPRVSEVLAAEFGRPLALDAHPKHDVALGAALGAGAQPLSPSQVGAVTDNEPVTVPPADAPQPAVVHLAPTPTAVRTTSTRATMATLLRKHRTSLAIAVGGLALTAGAAVAISLANKPDSVDRTSSAATGSKTAKTGSTASGAPTVTTSPAGDRLDDDFIVWSRRQISDGAFALFAIRFDGTGEKQLTAWQKATPGANISPGRTQVVYAPDHTLRRVQQLTGKTQDTAFFANLNLARSCQRLNRPAWANSPPKAYFVVRCADLTEGSQGLYRLDFDGQARQLLPGYVREPTVSPDGQYLVYWRGSKANAPNGQLFLADLHESGLRPTALTPSQADHDSSPAWSPDGTRLVFRRHVGGVDAIFTMPVLTKAGLLPEAQRTPRQLYRSDTNAAFPSWSPNGKMVVFDRGPENAAELWVMDFAAGQKSAHRVMRRSPEYADSIPVWFTR
jgi:Tol biopolymer transport system component